MRFRSLVFASFSFLFSACGPDIPYGSSASNEGEINHPSAAESPAPPVPATSTEGSSNEGAPHGDEGISSSNDANKPSEPSKPGEEEARMIAAEGIFSSALISRSGDINLALMDLIINNQTDAIKVAKSHGADFNFKDKEFMRPLCFAIEHNRQEAMEVLLEGGAQANYLAKAISPLARAVHAKRNHLIAPLIKGGANVNFHFFQGQDAYAALHVAANINSIEGIKILLSHGADPNIRQGADSFPANIAAYKGFPEALKLLLEAGANPRNVGWFKRDIFQMVDDKKGQDIYPQLMAVVAPYR